VKSLKPRFGLVKVEARKFINFIENGSSYQKKGEEIKGKYLQAGQIVTAAT
jgi:hypothetical protein